MADFVTLRPKAAIFDRVRALLLSTTGVESYFAGGGTHMKPLRYVWEPGPMTTSGATSLGDTPRRMFDLACSFAVSCHASDYDDACSLAADLVTAVEQVMLGNSYTIQSLDLADNSGESSTAGWTIVVSLTVTISLPESRLNGAGYITAQATTFEFIPGDGTDPDGVLTAPRT